MPKNLYELLGTREDADAFEIRDAAQQKANEINNAFKILSNPESRAAYDAQLKQQKVEKKEFHNSLLTLKFTFISTLQLFSIFIILALVLSMGAWLLPHLGLPKQWYIGWYEYRYYPALIALAIGFLLVLLKLFIAIFKRL
jgi:curved DNA-binding protein CbpA